MKTNKFIVSLSLSFVLLASCGSSGNYLDPAMPEELITYNNELLEENLMILDEDPENITALFEVAYRYEQLGEYKSAIKSYKKVLDLDAVHEPALNNLSGIYEEMGEYDDASVYMMSLYQVKPLSFEVITDTVRVLLLADDADHAQEALDNFKLETEANAEAQELASNLQADIDAYLE